MTGDGPARLFADAMTRTLARTLHVLDDDTVFVITGDIPAMWLRDSATQMLPYLRIAHDHPDGPLADLLTRTVVLRDGRVVYDGAPVESFEEVAHQHAHGEGRVHVDYRPDVRTPIDRAVTGTEEGTR